MKKITSGLIAILMIIHCSSRTPEERLIEKALKIHESAITIDSHLDTPLNLLKEGWEFSVYHHPDSLGSGKIDLPRMIQGGLDAAFFAVFVGQSDRTPEGYGKAFDQAERMVAAIRKTIAASPEQLSFSSTPNDVIKLESAGKRIILMGMENGYPLGTDFSKVRYFYDQGVRYITLCHTRNNDLCDSANDTEEWGGVSPFGKRVIEEMNTLGMMIDVSHLSDKAFFDVLEISKAPIIASHSCARAVYDNPRNMSDSMLVALAEHGGLCQINLCSFYLKKLAENPKRDAAIKVLREKYGTYYQIKDQETQTKYIQEWELINAKYPGDLASVQDLADHIDHAVQVAGVDHVGIGSDFDGGADIERCREVSEIPNITIELVRRGYTKEDIHKIWGGNLLRVFGEVEKTGELIKN